MTAEEVRARMSTQASASERAALADVVITNDGDLGGLCTQVDDLWARLERMRAR
jgi:dephospho-CoA kinase